MGLNEDSEITGTTETVGGRGRISDIQLSLDISFTERMRKNGLGVVLLYRLNRAWKG